MGPFLVLRDRRVVFKLLALFFCNDYPPMTNVTRVQLRGLLRKNKHWYAVGSEGVDIINVFSSAVNLTLC